MNFKRQKYKRVELFSFYYSTLNVRENQVFIFEIIKGKTLKIQVILKVDVENRILNKKEGP